MRSKSRSAHGSLVDRSADPDRGRRDAHAAAGPVPVGGAAGARDRVEVATHTTVGRGVQAEVRAITAELDPYAVAAGFDGCHDL